MKVALILGGARSGKSRYAVELAQALGPSILYLATCRPADAEMRRRITRHRRERPSTWRTLEAPDDLPAALLAHSRWPEGRGTASIGGSRSADGVLLDCLTLYLADLLRRHRRDALVEREVARLCRALPQVRCPVIVVSNEVGAGVVPERPLGRRFRDLAGWANQAVARCADRVILMVAGMPLVVKSETADVTA